MPEYSTPVPGNMNSAASSTLVLWCRVAEVKDEVLEAAARALSLPDRARAASFVRTDDQKMFVASRWLMGLALAECGLDARLHSAAGSAPVLTGLHGAARQISLSHGGGWVAVAVAQAGAASVGVDVEHVGRPVDAMALAPGVVDPAELALLQKLAPDARNLRFLQGWTLREAWAKAEGKGLSADLASVRIDPSGRYVSVPENAAWTLLSVRPEPELLLAVAVRHPGVSPVPLTWGKAIFDGEAPRIAHTTISPAMVNWS